MKHLKKFFVSVLVITIVIGIIGCITPDNVQAASNKMTRYQFIEKVVGKLNGKLSAIDSKFEGKKITVKTTKAGKVTVAGKSTSAATVKKYMNKYGITLKQAEVIAEAVSMGIIKASTFTTVKKNISRSEAAVILAKANELAHGKNMLASGHVLTDEEISVALNERITDIGKIKSAANREWFAKAYLFGYMSGKSDGAYTHTRTFSPKAYPTKATLEDMIERLYDSSKRVPLSSDWQVCRTTKLPKTAKYYKYIIDSFPNSYYDTAFNGMGVMGSKFFNNSFNTKLKERVGMGNFCFVFPYEIEEYNSYPYPSDIWNMIGMQYEAENRNNDIPAGLVKSSVEFYTYALNVNYKTIKNDKEWRDVMSKYLDSDEIDTYIEHCIKNKTIIECDKVAADLSSCYCYDYEYNCKVYAHFRVISDEPLSKNLDDDEMYGTLYPIKRGRELGDRYSRYILEPLYMDYKMGEWTDYYFNTNAESDMYGYLNTSCTTWDIMIDYTGDYPWLLVHPYR